MSPKVNSLNVRVSPVLLVRGVVKEAHSLTRDVSRNGHPPVRSLVCLRLPASL